MRTRYEDFGITPTPMFLAEYAPPFQIANERQVLTTGHLAPKNDPDIRENNFKTRSFPHCSLLGEDIRAVVKPGQCALDVGAFIGDNSFEFTEYGLKTIGIEPFLDAHECAVINAPDAIIVHAACGNGELVQLEYRCHGDNHGMRAVYPNGGAQGVPFKSLRIDDLKIQTLHLLKIDSEGSEPRILAGAKDTISRLKPVLIVEANPNFIGQHGCAELKNVMESMGYSVYGQSERVTWDWIGIPK